MLPIFHNSLQVQQLLVFDFENYCGYLCKQHCYFIFRSIEAALNLLGLEDYMFKVQTSQLEIEVKKHCSLLFIYHSHSILQTPVHLSSLFSLVSPATNASAHTQTHTHTTSCRYTLTQTHFLYLCISATKEQCLSNQGPRRKCCYVRSCKTC